MSGTLADAIAAADRQLDGSVAATTAGREGGRDGAHGHRYVLLSIATAHYAVREAFVTELERVPKITPVPHVPSWVRGVTNLRELALVNTRVTDEGLAYLGGLKRLEKLTLGGAAITDRGLAALRGLPELRDLDLFGTRVTEAGVRQLKAALPQLRVMR